MQSAAEATAQEALVSTELGGNCNIRKGTRLANPFYSLHKISLPMSAWGQLYVLHCVKMRQPRRHPLSMTANNRPSMPGSGNSSDFASLNSVLGCVLGHLIFVGGARLIRLLNERMPPFFGVKYRHTKLWISLFDSKRHLLGRFVSFVSGLQLPIYDNMKWFGRRRFAGFLDRGHLSIVDRRPRLSYPV
jgi:hypothetical protein